MNNDRINTAFKITLELTGLNTLEKIERVEYNCPNCCRVLWSPIDICGKKMLSNNGEEYIICLGCCQGFHIKGVK